MIATEVPHQMLTRSEVSKLIRVSTRTLYKLIQSGDFPPPTKIGTADRWSQRVVSQWVESKSAANDGAQ